MNACARFKAVISKDAIVTWTLAHELLAEIQKKTTARVGPFNRNLRSQPCH